jgi:GT2 family glycosyltransferase
VLPIRNERSHVAACLEAIRRQTYPAELLEVIVVDGESTDGTADIVAKAASGDERIRMVTNADRTMPVGLNIGIRAASGDFVGVVSGHSVLPPDYVASAVDASLDTGAWSVGGRIVRRAETPMHRAIAIATSSRVGVGDSLHNYAAKAGWVETVFPGFWRRSLFDRVGPFDPEMIANEDNELSLRIRKAGGRIWYDPEIQVEYTPRASLGGLFQQYRDYGLGKMRVLRKHRGGLRWRHLVPAAWVAFVVAGGLLSILVPGVALIWLLGLAVYALTILVAGLRLQAGSATWWRIALALVTIHHAYGIGTWQGLLTWRATARRG